MPTSLTRSVWSAWKPLPQPNHLEWVPKNIRMPDETESPGPFDLDTFPHCDGPLDAADDPNVREIYLPWSSRLGKTITGISILGSCADQAPRPAMIAREDKDRVDDLIKHQVFPLFDACRKLRPLLPPRSRRDPKHGIRLPKMRIRRAYSGSPATMAGFPACYALASEVSKWQKKKSTEADPIYLFRKRGMLFPYDSKYIFESTPGEKGQCNITDLCSAPGVDVRRRVVPCPHCDTYQTLVFGGSGDGAGLKWETRVGVNDPQLAEETAYYRCENGCEIHSPDRADMLRKGIWISENQRVTKAGKVIGKRPVSANVAFGHPISAPFGALYSLMLTGWGQIAREWCTVADSLEGKREFYNQTLGICWDPSPTTVEPEDVITRMGTDAPLGRCPEWSRFLTVGVDAGQHADQLFFYYWVSAWGEKQRGQLVQCGLLLSSEELRRFIDTACFPHADGGESLRPIRWGIDSGKFTTAIYDFVDQLKRPDVFCLKGSSDDGRDFSDLKMLEMFRLGMRRAGVSPVMLKLKEKLRQYDLVLPNTRLSQEWCQNRLDGLVTREHPGWYSIPEEAFFTAPLGMPGESLVKHVIGDVRDSQGRWNKRWERQDLRDAWRYSVVAAFHRTENGTQWERLPQRGPRVMQTTQPQQQVPPAAPFLATDR